MDGKSAITALSALGQETRLAMYRLLTAAGPQGLPAGEIAARLGLIQNTASAHLGILGEAGLIAAHREGRIVRHAIEPAAMQALIGYLTRECCNGNPSACGFAAAPSISGDSTMSEPFKVLFLCTGNSARSILAEALMNRVGSPNFKAWSAGSQPKGAVHPKSIELLQSLGYDTSGFRSKSWDEFAQEGAPQFDFIFTVCDSAAGEACPVWLGHPVTAHWGIPDPAAANGTDAQISLAFAEAYRQMKNRIEAFTALPLASLDRMARQKEADAIGKMQD
jgi:ArsR family transcriptional regulator, arsenate/arsenite/antimonite-responsive transcriptional repressor / arsenate reductase (thioredoxin)